jgi:hypothetical protein
MIQNQQKWHCYNEFINKSNLFKFKLIEKISTSAIPNQDH